MAGHRRTVATGQARRTTGRRVRQVRQHLPAGEAEQYARRQARDGAKAMAYQRINRTSDPMQQLEAARDYVRSAAAKYRNDLALKQAVKALLAVGDEIFHDGTRRRRR